MRALAVTPPGQAARVIRVLGFWLSPEAYLDAPLGSA